MSTTELSSPGTYTPGYVWSKRLMVLCGVVLLVAGLWELRTPFWLLAFGTRATAEAVDVVKTKPGLPDVVLKNDAQLQAALETHDRSYIFWNDFRFEAGGHPFIARAPVGSQLQPLYPLLDADGLPTTDPILYDAKDPGTFVFPRIISTWFAPGVILFIGFLVTFIGAFLLYWSDKPIELPHIPNPSAKA